jgi:competence ComEA-like helix-hairpin-helix protein
LGYGDSFPVALPDGRKITARLYGVDCIETHVNNETDARRLRSQRRYFGIGGGDTAESMVRAREYGRQASKRTAELLRKPFTVHTAFTDARGDSDSQRYYVFITTSNGLDLASTLVKEGLARAFGITRQRSDGMSSSDYRAALQDLELTAAAARTGVWAWTDWAHLAENRADERREAAELSALIRPSVAPKSLNPNTATLEELKQIKGIGPKLAHRIVEARGNQPFQSLDDLRRIKGMSDRIAQQIAPSLMFQSPDKPNVKSPTPKKSESR